MTHREIERPAVQMPSLRVRCMSVEGSRFAELMGARFRAHGPRVFKAGLARQHFFTILSRFVTTAPLKLRPPPFIAPCL